MNYQYPACRYENHKWYKRNEKGEYIRIGQRGRKPNLAEPKFAYVINGERFESIGIAMSNLAMPLHKIVYRCKSKKEQWVNWIRIEKAPSLGL